MKFKHALQTLLFTIVLATSAATCNSRLEPGGAYAPAGQEADMAFYAVDAAYDLAYFAADAAFKFESDNRALLWQVSPNIKHALDSIRPQAVQANLDYHKARVAYKANPVPSNLAAMQGVLAKMQQLSATAAAVLPQQPKP